MNKKKLEKKIRKMFKNASPDDWGVPCVYESHVRHYLLGEPWGFTKVIGEPNG